MGLFSNDHAKDGKDAISRGDVSGALEAAMRQKDAEDSARDAGRDLSSDRDHGGLSSFSK
jgi:hypothetical protein